MRYLVPHVQNGSTPVAHEFQTQWRALNSPDPDVAGEAWANVSFAAFGGAVGAQLPSMRRPVGAPVQVAQRFDDLIDSNYRNFYNEATAQVFTEYNAGHIRVPQGTKTATVLGRHIDADARHRLNNFLAQHGIPEGPGMDILVNRRLYDPTGSGKHRIPDVRLPDSRLILDGTINKSFLDPQIQDMIRYSGGEVRLVYPTVPLPRH